MINREAVRPPAAEALDALAEAAAKGPLVIGQLGQTLDGRIATAVGHSHYVNGAVALDHLHRLRALVDAVVVGAGTVTADDPSLTVRRVDGDNPVRVVLTPEAECRARERCSPMGRRRPWWLDRMICRYPLAPTAGWRPARCWTRSP